MGEGGRVGPDGYAQAAAVADRRTGLPPDRVGSLYRLYEDEKRQRRVIDFDDLLADCATAMEDRTSPTPSGGASGTCSSTSSRT